MAAKLSFGDRIALACAALLPILVFALIFYYRPFWGLMDDAVNIGMARTMKEQGFLTVWWSESMSDLFGNGRLRFLYPAMIGLLYAPAGANSLVTFSANALLVCASFVFLAFVYARSAASIYRTRSHFAFALSFFLFCFAYPWTQYLFLAPSVQEKLVLLFSGIVVAALYMSRNAKNDLLWLASLALPLLLALNTKEQIVLFFPLFLAIQFQAGRPDKRGKRLFLLLLLLLASTALLWWAGKHGSYKARYGLESALVNLRKSKSVWLFLGLGFMAELAALQEHLRRTRDLPRFLHASTYPAGLVLFVLIMLPWGMGFYLNAAALIFCFFCLYGIAQAALPQGWLEAYAKVFLIPAALLGVAGMAPGFSAYGDLGRLLSSGELKVAAENQRELNIPCQEGAERIQQYAKWFHGLDLVVKVPLASSAEEVLGQGGLWITSPLRCTNGVDFLSLAEQSRAKVLFRGRYASGFHLIEVGK